MAEIAIQRVNFFDGQFLKQGEFNDLSAYMVHLRRRLLFVLFDQSGVVQASPTDLTIAVPNQAQKVIQVKAGMAIGMRPDLAEAKEVILREDTLPIDLATLQPPLQAGDTGIVTVHYDEEGVAVPPSEGDVPGNTRINEKAIITVHRNTLPAPSAPNGEPFIRLGNITFDSMATAPAQRQVALIKTGLLGGGGPQPQAPTITAINPNQAGQGVQNQAVTITGTNFTGVTSVGFTNAGISAQNVAANATGTQITATLNVAVNATLGPSTFVVTTPNGMGQSGAVTFTVLATPQIANILPGTQIAGQTIQLRGVNLRDPQLGINVPAIGTTVAFLVQNTQAVLASGTNVTTLQDVANGQAISVTIPVAAAWNPPPAPGSNVTVRVRVTFNGVLGVSAGTLQVNF